MEFKLYRIFAALENQSSLFWKWAGIITVGLLGVIDYLTGNEIVFSLFYLVPIILVTWSVNQEMGLFLSFLSGLMLLGAEIAAGETYSHPIIYFWNTLIRTVFYSFFSFLVSALHKSQKEERLAARTDFVTGAVNARYFNELLNLEVERIRRYPHPITVVFMDIDDFKLVNDLFGHKVGDEVLRSIAGELKSQLRKTDVVARVGGDEFALLLPSAHQPEAKMVISKVHANLKEAMTLRNWPVTFSMGVVTCLAPPYSTEQIINMADELMYEVKNSTKNDFHCATWDGKNFRRQ
ncbi:MAG TPA: GGDEF domain-containing protein [Anaerolineales bacterium]|nr:GGDEF domain-containing protein [Anaerolineales bacterium]